MVSFRSKFAVPSSIIPNFIHIVIITIAEFEKKILDKNFQSSSRIDLELIGTRSLFQFSFVRSQWALHFCISFFFLLFSSTRFTSRVPESFPIFTWIILSYTWIRCSCWFRRVWIAITSIAKTPSLNVWDYAHNCSCKWNISFIEAQTVQYMID